MNACVKVANFPYIKTLEGFDFSYQPSINRGQIFDFKNFGLVTLNWTVLLKTVQFSVTNPFH